MLPLNDTADAPADTLFVEVVLPLSLAATFTYRVPRELNAEVAVGKRVVVQFGAKRIYSAIVWAIHHQPPKKYEAKYLLSVLDETPLLQQKHLDFWRWMAGYYMCNLGDVMAAALPAGMKLESETVILRNENGDPDSTALTDNEYLVYEALDKHNSLTISEIQQITGKDQVFSLVKSLYKKNLILTSEELKDKYKPKYKTMLRLVPGKNDDHTLQGLFEQLEKRSPKQSDLLLAYLSLSPAHEWVEKKTLISRAQATPASLQGLIEKQVLEQAEWRTDRWTQENGETSPLVLNTEQEAVYASLMTQFSEGKDTALLHGITGSGKSFVYFAMIAHVLQEQKQVLYLLPEIALTFQLINKLRKYFGDKVWVSHSRFSDNERVEIYAKVASGEPLVIIGARSAIFLPFHNLGLVVVDEEHDPSFKQYDPAPRYHARDCAIYLAGKSGAKCILGSATPSIESYFNAKSGKYAFAELHHRFGEAKLPLVELVNIQEQEKKNLMRSFFSNVLLEEIKKANTQHLQSIVFQNRKGYVPVTLCKNCGWTPRCISCDIGLTYYKSANILKCNYCGYRQKPAGTCPSCGSHHIELSGVGTERLEEELELLAPELRIQRFDQESTRNKSAHQQIISDFEEGKTDVLVGTQMVTKGLDFDNVHIVGVISADQMMNFPDFRAHERAFQLMSQVAGRAGRRKEPGKVLIQTYRESHPLLSDVIAHDYQSFYAREVAERDYYKYPPFYRLIHITLRHKEKDTLETQALAFTQLLKQSLGDRVLGPEAPLVSRIRNYYVKQVLVKIEKEKVSLNLLKGNIIELLTQFHDKKENKGLVVNFDVDPY